MHEKSPSITTDTNTIQKLSKLIDLMTRIELSRAILTPWLSNFLWNWIIHFCMFLYLVICFLRVTVSLLCRLQSVSKIHVPIYSYLISEGRRNFSILWSAQQRNRDSQETCTKHQHMRNGWSNFLENLKIVALKLLELTLFA